MEGMHGEPQHWAESAIVEICRHKALQSPLTAHCYH
jgi:hypothetical protein